MRASNRLRRSRCQKQREGNRRTAGQRGVEQLYGLGLIAGNGWRLQNPNLNGYSGVLGYQTHGKITVAITTTNSPASAAADEAFSQQAFKRIAEYLSPGHQPPLGP